jgi:hypothetical protein
MNLNVNSCCFYKSRFARSSLKTRQSLNWSRISLFLRNFKVRTGFTGCCSAYGLTLGLPVAAVLTVSHWVYRLLQCLRSHTGFTGCCSAYSVTPSSCATPLCIALMSEHCCPRWSLALMSEHCCPRWSLSPVYASKFVTVPNRLLCFTCNLCRL